MTIAICMRCGKPKVGAFTLCPDCGFEPKNQLEHAQALLLSDHFESADRLEQLSDEIEQGRAIDFDTDKLNAALAAVLSEDVRAPLALRLAVWAPVVLMLALAVLIVAMHLLR